MGPPGPDMRSWNALITFGLLIPAAISGSDFLFVIIDGKSGDIGAGVVSDIVKIMFASKS